MKNWTKLSHLLMVRTEGPDTPPPLIVSLTVKYPLFFLTTSLRVILTYAVHGSPYLSLTGLLTAIRGLNIHSHLYLRVLSPPGPCQALTINCNNQTIRILKLSLFSQFNSSQFPGRPQLTRKWI